MLPLRGFLLPGMGGKWEQISARKEINAASPVFFSFLFTQGESSFRWYQGVTDAAHPIAITASDRDATLPPGGWFTVSVNLVTDGKMICDILFVLHNFSAYHTSHHMWGLLWDGKVKRKKREKIITFIHYYYLLAINSLSLRTYRLDFGGEKKYSHGVIMLQDPWCKDGKFYTWK